MYQFKYMLNDDDYWEFNKFHLSNAPANKKALLVLRLMVPVILAISSLLSLNNYKNFYELIAQIILFVIFSVAWFFIVKPLTMLIMKLNIKIIKKDGKLPYGKDVLIQFEEDFFIETTNETETKTKYTSIEKIAAGGNRAIYIYISSVQAFIIPFSVFESEKQRDAFLAFINYKAGTTGGVPQ